MASFTFHGGAGEIGGDGILAEYGDVTFLRSVFKLVVTL